MYNQLTKKKGLFVGIQGSTTFYVLIRGSLLSTEFSRPLSSKITKEDELETLKIEIEKRKRQVRGAELERPVQGPVILNGLRVRESSGTTTHDKQRGDEGPVYPGGSAT
ncbi:hypothetical protein QBC36DRAFT_100115 [Triangularia setosa]|uniref:Uncharacterized protein n=1 Tax=Triangularia setosa TaxID=2587417 RepID=A0AAN6VXY4_9PEZI|nr:hypothetical protein QBC36DRAFT_100115 [Podospora setosa]